MDYAEVKKFFKKNVSYKDGWEFHIKKKKTDGIEQDAFYLQIQFIAADNFNGKPERQFCRKWLLSEFMTPTELVRTAWLAVQQAERHEMEETFRYKGRDIYNSHLSVDSLAKLCDSNSYEHRSPPPKPPKTKKYKCVGCPNKVEYVADYKPTAPLCNECLDSGDFK
jgi:hypothetical protein